MYNKTNIFTVTTVDRNNRNVLGYKFYIVQTNSMSLSDKNQHLDIHFDAGDIVVVKNPEDPRALQPGQVISFMSTNEVSYGETVTHMIRSVKKTDDGRVLGYVTYGTNTDTDDEALVTPDYVLGVHQLTLPKVGTFFAFVKSVPGYICCILVPFLLAALVLGCTHYPFVKKTIARILGEDTELLDGSLGTARETKRRLEAAGLLGDGPGEVIIEDSAPDGAVVELARRLLEQPEL